MPKQREKIYNLCVNNERKVYYLFLKEERQIKWNEICAFPFYAHFFPPNFYIVVKQSITGIIKGDEIMVINGAIVSDLDMMYLESVLQEELALCMMMRSSRTEPPDLAGLMRTTDDIIESLVCPPPPSDGLISEEMISGLIVPAPGWSKYIALIKFIFTFYFIF